MDNDDIKEILINSFHNKCENCLLNGCCHLGEYEDDPKPCMQD